MEVDVLQQLQSSIVLYPQKQPTLGAIDANRASSGGVLPGGGLFVGNELNKPGIIDWG